MIITNFEIFILNRYISKNIKYKQKINGYLLGVIKKASLPTMAVFKLYRRLLLDNHYGSYFVNLQG